MPVSTLEWSLTKIHIRFERPLREAAKEGLDKKGQSGTALGGHFYVLTELETAKAYSGSGEA